MKKYFMLLLNLGVTMIFHYDVFLRLNEKIINRFLGLIGGN